MSNQEYQRRIYLINPRFQLRTSLFTASLAFIASLPYPYVIYQIIKNFFDKLKVGDFCSNLNGLANSFEGNRKDLIIFLVAWQLGFCLFVFILGIFQSHKIAGPIHKLKMLLGEITSGTLPSEIKFRNGDHFPELAEEFNKALASLRERKSQDYLYLEEIEKFLEEVLTSSDSEEKDRIKQMLEKLNQMKLSVSR